MAFDFRSDTLTRPTDEMRQAMARAEVGDDVFGEDPTVRALEAEGAELLGQDAALFVPSGTMANQVAIHVHCRPGDELVCERRSHVFQFEGGSVARLSGTQVWPLEAESGHPAPEQLAAAVRRQDAHFPRSRLLVIENTHNMAGGTVLGPAAMAALCTRARELALAVHVDGARLVNAAVASGCSVADLTRGADSVSMCLSKGLGAPLGSLVAGSSGFVAEARRARKAFGGGMRQVGVVAAAGRVALRRGPDWVTGDHRVAAELARGLAAVEGLSVAPPPSNIVMVDLAEAETESFLGQLDEHGVRALAVGPGRIRFVTHHDLDGGAVEACLAAARRWCDAGPRSAH